LLATVALRWSPRPRGCVVQAEATKAAPEAVEAWCDGACSGNPGPGAWGAVLRFRGHERELCGFDPQTTNNRMELMGAIGVLEALKRGCRVHLHTDSQYVCKGIQEWLPNWIRRGWKTAGGKPVLNRDLWERLAAQVARSWFLVTETKLQLAAAQDQPLQFGTTVQSLDSFFAVDTTGSMGPEIQTLNTSLTNTIIPGVKAGAAKDAQFGVAAVEDYSVSPFGGTNVFPGNIDDQPLIMLQSISADVTAATGPH